MTTGPLTNPFRPGAGHRPPYLAGRSSETQEFKKLLAQDIVIDNMVLTGLRGTGKTVLLDTFKPIAISEGWLWVGTDLSETASLSEDNIVIRVLTDLSVVTERVQIGERQSSAIGFGAATVKQAVRLDFKTLLFVYEKTPGLPSDKLKQVLQFAWSELSSTGAKGIVFAYDEAQNMTDHAANNTYPLSLLLDAFQPLQRKDFPFLLVLAGLPTLFPKLVETRTHSERMFRVVLLDRLSKSDSRDAITKPIEDAACPVVLDPASVNLVVDISGGYPYFIQFICREVFDAFVQGHSTVPVDAITRKLDTDFFAGRWSRVTDRQRDLLFVVAHLDSADAQFTVQEITEMSKELLEKGFSSSHINQMLGSLANAGLVYKNRHGKYSFAVPLLGQFILRQEQQNKHDTGAQGDLF